jgi:hypothetical protein
LWQSKPIHSSELHFLQKKYPMYSRTEFILCLCTNIQREFNYVLKYRVFDLTVYIYT